MQKRLTLISCAVLLMALLVSGCGNKKPAESTDTFLRVVVVEKSDSLLTDGVLKVVHLMDEQVDETMLFVIILKEDAAHLRPYNIIWDHIGVGSNLAFEYLNSSGNLKYKLDNICTMTTDEIVLLDKPSDFEEMVGIAAQKQKQKLLTEQQELAKLRQIYQPVPVPQE